AAGGTPHAAPRVAGYDLLALERVVVLPRERLALRRFDVALDPVARAVVRFVVARVDFAAVRLAPLPLAFAVVRFAAVPLAFVVVRLAVVPVAFAVVRLADPVAAFAVVRLAGVPLAFAVVRFVVPLAFALAPFDARVVPAAFARGF